MKKENGKIQLKPVNKQDTTITKREIWVILPVIKHILKLSQCDKYAGVCTHAHAHTHTHLNSILYKLKVTYKTYQRFFLIISGAQNSITKKLFDIILTTIWEAVIWSQKQIQSESVSYNSDMTLKVHLENKYRY